MKHVVIVYSVSPNLPATFILLLIKHFLSKFVMYVNIAISKLSIGFNAGKLKNFYQRNKNE